MEPESYWYSTRPLPEQARRVHALASDEGTTIAFSADLAPDLLAPWRHPTVAIAYASDPLPADRAGLVPAEGRADASLVTDDRIQTGETDEVAGQAGQRPFIAETAVPSDFFDRLLEDLDEDAVVAPALSRAVERSRSAPRIARRQPRPASSRIRMNLVFWR